MSHAALPSGAFSYVIDPTCSTGLLICTPTGQVLGPAEFTRVSYTASYSMHIESKGKAGVYKSG